MRPSLFGALLSLLLALGCGPSSPGAWERIDLWGQAPRIEVSPFVNKAKPPYRAEIGYLGAQEVRNLAQVPPETFATYPHQAAGQVEVLRQVAGSTLAFRVTPGRGGYLSFTPLLDDKPPCACTFRVRVRASGETTEVHQVSPAAPPAGLPPLAPAAERVDLSRWAGKEIDLLLSIDGPDAQSWGGWASPAVYSRGPDPSPTRTDRPNLILIGVDTLRADHVSPKLTPAIDALSRESDVWTSAYSTFNVTNPSFASILTGLWGKNHGVYDLKTPLPPSHTTLAELLDGAGYDTFAVISAHHLGAHNSGLGQGFDDTFLADEHAAAELGVERSMGWITARKQPFFLWLHLFDPHTPHTPPQPFARGLAPTVPTGLGPISAWAPFRPEGLEPYEQPVLAGNVHLYASEVAYLDHQVGRLLDFLDSRGLLGNTIVALVADHGENLGEHGILTRHIGLWETTTHVPLLIRWPESLRQDGRGAGRRFHGLVQTIDLFPTLLAALGLPVPPQDGEELYRLTAGARPGRRAVFSEDANRMGVAIRTREHFYLRAAGNPLVPDGPHLYDLAADRAEEQDLAGRGLAIEEQLSRALTAWLADRRESPEALERQLSPEEIAKLKALGYL